MKLITKQIHFNGIKKLIFSNFKMYVYCTKSQGSTVSKSMKWTYFSREGTAHTNFREHLLLEVIWNVCWNITVFPSDRCIINN